MTAWWRLLALRGWTGGDRLGVAVGVATMTPLGGFVPLLGRWVAEKLTWGDGRSVAAALGGVWGSFGPDRLEDFEGLSLERRDAPERFDEVARMSRELATR
ncbi:hypothetical protein Isop_1290 [Isosphaera pallida ATCC 43644]|uniref:Uncharacterized protein n=1 Tax=Isosphaera pallida (strain ATCC 43644 / DSM 9630 / IS1B) TaxID=575540 RepID=E8QWI4_ISOPI|nr:hypothetical protein [Isosphaera pallida]ADV61876.1 hypothetical protein Isop_1290 [Isosphaera pallida ATCC 43644]